MLWRCWLGGRKGIRPVETERWGAGVVICLEGGADLHMAQLMPLPLTVSCFSKIQFGFTSLVPAYPGSPGKRADKWVCVCVLYHAVHMSSEEYITMECPYVHHSCTCTVLKQQWQAQRMIFMYSANGPLICSHQAKTGCFSNPLSWVPNRRACRQLAISHKDKAMLHKLVNIWRYRNYYYYYYTCLMASFPGQPG